MSSFFDNVINNVDRSYMYVVDWEWEDFPNEGISFFMIFFTFFHLTIIDDGGTV